MNTHTKFVLVPESEVPKLVHKRNTYYENPTDERERIINDHMLDPRIKKKLSRDLLIRELARKKKLNPYKNTTIHLDADVDNPMNDETYRNLLARDQGTDTSFNEFMDIQEDPLSSAGWEESMPPFTTSSPVKSKSTSKSTSGYQSLPSFLNILSKAKRESDAGNSSKDADLYEFDDIIGKLMETKQLVISKTKIVIDGEELKRPPRNPVQAWFDYMQGYTKTNKPYGMNRLLRLMAKNKVGFDLCLNPSASSIYKDHMIRLGMSQSGKNFTYPKTNWLPWKPY